MINFSANTPKHSIWITEAVAQVNRHTSSCAFTSYHDSSRFFRRAWVIRSQCFSANDQWSHEIFTSKVDEVFFNKVLVPK